MIPRKLTQEIERWIRESKFGNLQINFVGGKITNVNRTESLKVECIGNAESISANSTNVSEDVNLEK